MRSPRDPLKESICSCKATGFCRHCQEAVLQYQVAQGAVTIDDFREEEPLRVPEDTLAELRQQLDELLVLGLSRLPETSLDRMEQAAVICHGTGLPHLEKLFRELRQEAELYFQKNASFDRNNMRNTVTKLYAFILALQAKNGTVEARQLAGEHKSSYFDIPPLELVGMGAGAWSSKVGYEGITYYFFNKTAPMVYLHRNQTHLL